MRKTSLITATVLLFVINLFGQGIKFESNLTWDQILAKARSENKYVFVDCYATWCGPCKTMDLNVYPQEAVGNYFNQHFISVKIQMDKTTKDEEGVVKWYKDAEKLMSQYKVNAFPTFLFLSPDGQLVHKAIGGYNASDIIGVAKNALDPAGQYYTMLSEFDQGKRDTSVMKQLARTASRFGDRDKAKEIAEHYINMISKDHMATKDNIALISIELDNKQKAREIGEQYLKMLSQEKLLTRESIIFIRDTMYDENLAQAILNKYLTKLKDEELFKKENIELLSSFTKSSSDKSFRILYSNRQKVDLIMNIPNYSQRLIDYIIAKEEIDPNLKRSTQTGNEPNWKQINRHIKKRFSKDYADRTILLAKSRWYSFRKNHDKYIQNKVSYVKRYGENMNNFEINNELGWPVFMYSTNPDVLLYAISRMKTVVTQEPDFLSAIDTYANLLYKVGRKDEAIKWQQLAVKKEPNDKSLKIALDDMKLGKPTYLNQGAIWK